MNDCKLNSQYLFNVKEDFANCALWGVKNNSCDETEVYFNPNLNENLCKKIELHLDWLANNKEQFINSLREKLDIYPMQRVRLYFDCQYEQGVILNNLPNKVVFEDIVGFLELSYIDFRLRFEQKNLWSISCYSRGLDLLAHHGLEVVMNENNEIVDADYHCSWSTDCPCGKWK